MKQRLLFFSLILFLFTGAMAAKEQKDTAFANLYRHYFELFNDSDETAFYDASEKLKEYYQQRQKTDSYYKVWLNEVLYDTNYGKAYRAIKKANLMLEEMKQKDEKHYNIVYSALGNIYDLRGNYRMAYKYFQEALKNCAPNDTSSLLDIYSRMVSLQAHREPLKALETCDLLGKMAINNPEYYKVYTALKSEIAFYLYDKKRFEEAYQQYLDISKKHPVIDAYGKDIMEMVKATFEGDYDKALKILSKESTDFDALDCCDMRIKIYELMGNREMALSEVSKRRDLRDSLNSDMLFESINEINAEMGIHKIQEQADRKQKLLLSAIILLLLAALGLLVWRHLTRRGYQKRLLKQNKELEIALDRAQESDRMKTSFIEHVSHEIRTPLNIITGFVQIISNSDYQLKESERNIMLNDISKNTAEITNIVNELLEMAEDESKELYEMNEDINVDKFCQGVIAQAELINNGYLKLTYSSFLDKDYTFRSNRQAVSKILGQLMKNAMKFTSQGKIELKVRERVANGGIEFSVTDTGIGVEQQYHEKIFERFFKVNTFTQGLGLGLTMSRKIAKLLGGSLDIDPSYKKGARFLLVLPS